MPTAALICHPNTPCAFVSRIEVKAERKNANAIRLYYKIHGKLDRLSFAPHQKIGRCEGLWRHTCCEAFIKARGNDDYYEFNFAPSTAWALYRFSAYRQDMTAVPFPEAPVLTTRRSVQLFELETSLDLKPLALCDQPLDLALSVVIETEGGSLSYWAIKHPSGKADFHHPDAFALVVAD
ncbi:MAG: DOMON-like domain-containing protein [Gammaproteobacteria bacterium]